jgi:SAM-dependent methyltransferase
MAEFSPDYSSTGDTTLGLLDGAENFTEWMYSHVKPHLKGTILEIGSGSGTYSKKIIKDFPKNTIVLSDIDPGYIQRLSRDFTAPNIRVGKLNLEVPEDFSLLPSLADSAFALNVLEHVEQDTLALNNIYNNLNPGGVMVMLVPAHMFLYNRIDKSIGHFRRYSKKMIHEKIAETPFTLEKLYYFNALSMAGWYLNGNILKKEVVDDGLLSVFDRLVPLIRRFEKHIMREKIGISLIALLRK